MERRANLDFIVPILFSETPVSSIGKLSPLSDT